jgi:hypothetical protein
MQIADTLDYRAHGSARTNSEGPIFGAAHGGGDRFVAARISPSNGATNIDDHAIVCVIDSGRQIDSDVLLHSFIGPS